ncbi:zinc-binding dehydrogenase [Microbacterium lacticum]
MEDSLDVVLDTVGGPVLGFLARKLAKRGTIVLIGTAIGESAWIDAGQLMAKRIKIFSVDNPTPVGADLTEVLDLIATGKVNINVVELGTWHHLVSTSLSQLIGAGKTVLRVSK